MNNYVGNPEDFISDPNTIALVFDRESVDSAFLKQHPNVLVSKPLIGGYIIVYINEKDVEIKIGEIKTFTSSLFPYVLGLLNEAELNTSGIMQVQRHPYLYLRGNGVLLGFVDTGIDYTQASFRYEDGSSKIQYIWDQTIRGNPPRGYLYGSEYNNGDINRALFSSNPFEVVPHTDTVGHGTFLASVAGSREMDEFIGAAPDAEIIAVKLKKARPFDRRRVLIPREQENAFSSDDFMMGIQYILDKAQELRRPVAICVSLGTNMGGHDGFSTLERYLSRVSGIAGTAVCAAAGNEGKAGHHVHGRIISAGDSYDIKLRAGSKAEDIYLTMWNNASDRMSVSITSPTGERVGRVPARSGSIYRSPLVLERSTVTVEYLFPVEGSGGQFTRMRILAATPGVWTITVYGDSILDGTVNIWLPLTGFISPETKFLTPSPNFTVVTPATAHGVITCGAYDSRKDSLFDSSSWGPSRRTDILPDLAAPGVDIGGFYPTGYGRMSGTSVAAAITAGASALMLQWGIVQNNDISLDSFRVRGNLIRGCMRRRGVEYPNNQWGFGRLNLLDAFRHLRTL
ncbi:MAG: S8 family peptidase [Defluviitaleaceae bacterium]|nr:S8 family peptidase [Defluviitaleaceae bacterium]